MRRQELHRRRRVESLCRVGVPPSPHNPSPHPADRPRPSAKAGVSLFVIPPLPRAPDDSVFASGHTRLPRRRRGALAFVKENLRMFTAPSRAALPIFTDEDSKPHARATVTVLAALTQFQHPILQFVPYYPTPWGRRSNLDRGHSRRRAILANASGDWL